MLVVVPTGGANISSVTNALERLGVDFQLSESANVISSASKVILPGVGAAASAMKRLQDRGLIECIQNLSQPVLGICLGMQLLFENSQESFSEADLTPCLGMIPGTIEKITPPPGESIPHMGWNQVCYQNGGSDIFDGVEEKNYFYFVHSYKAPEGNFVKAYADFGEQIPALVSYNNFYGAQFHPEKSAAAGEQLLKNFIGLSS